MRSVIALLLLAVGAGCAPVQTTAGAGRPFDFQRDTFAYANAAIIFLLNKAY